MTTITVHGKGLEPFDTELDDETWALLQAYASRHRLTIDEAIARAIGQFLDAHPVFATRNEVQ